MISQENMLPVGTLLLGKTYRVEKQLASGGFGNTYVVKKVYFDETYAMKEFFMRSINLRQRNEVTVSVPDNHATFESQREKFKKEALRLREIHSPHIVRVHDLFEENGTVYYVMDYIDGTPLTRESKPLSEYEAMDVLHQVLQALKVIHSQSPQMLHLDIKPSNLIMDRQGRVFLIDFGSSKQLDAEHGITVSSGITLTKGYAPSELEDGKKERIGAWTDLYELGATLYNLLTCQQPPTPSEIMEDEATAFRFPVTVSQSTRELITWMMTPNRRKRPQTVEEIEMSLNSATTKLSEEETTFVNSTTNNKPDSEETSFLKPDVEASDKKKKTAADRTLMNYKPLLVAGALAIIGMLAWMVWPKDAILKTDQIDPGTKYPSGRHIIRGEGGNDKGGGDDIGLDISHRTDGGDENKHNNALGTRLANDVPVEKTKQETVTKSPTPHKETVNNASYNRLPDSLVKKTKEVSDRKAPKYVTIGLPKAITGRANAKNEFLISVPVINNSDEKITTEVTLYVDNVRLGEKSISIRSNGTSIVNFVVSDVKKEQYVSVYATSVDGDNSGSVRIRMLPFY